MKRGKEPLLGFNKMEAGKFFISLCLLVFCSCATIQGERKISVLCSWWPTNDQWYNAVVNAASHPGTWVPMIGTAVISAGGWDQDISEWARIEAGQHYPTDVLFGSALGNFIAILVHDAFLGKNEQNNISLQTDMKEEIILVFEIRF